MIVLIEVARGRPTEANLSSIFLKEKAILCSNEQNPA